MFSKTSGLPRFFPVCWPGAWHRSSLLKGWGVKLQTVSQREKGNMKGCSLLLLLLLLLHTCLISGSSFERELYLIANAPHCKPGAGGAACRFLTSGGSRLTRTSSLTGIVDLPVNHKGIGLAAGAGKSSCCKRPSLRNRKKMICCLPVNNRGRSQCPNSCD